MLKGKLQVSRNLDPAGDENLTIKGEVDLGDIGTALDPSQAGLTVSVTGYDAVPLMRIAVPGGEAPDRQSPGWSVNRSGTRWSYRDRETVQVPGVGKALLQHKANRGAGYYKFAISGKKSDFQVDTALAPLQFVIEFGDGAQSFCAATSFQPEAGSRPNCKIRGSGKTVRCG